MISRDEHTAYGLLVAGELGPARYRHVLMQDPPLQHGLLALPEPAGGARNRRATRRPSTSM